MEAATLAPPRLADDLIALLRCPETLQTVSLAPRELLDRIEACGQRDRAGDLLGRLEYALLRADGTLLFPIRRGIPMMLSHLAVPVLPDHAAP